MTGKSRNVAVIGLGTFGVSVATALTHMGDKVLGIDSDEALVQGLNDSVASTLQADATDPKALAECGLDSYDAVVVSIGENIQSSILAAMNVMDLKCPKVWVKAQNETQKRILEAIGVHHIVLPEHAYGQSIAQMIHNPVVKDFLSFGEDTYLVQVKLDQKRAQDLLGASSHLEANNLTCVGVIDDDEIVSPAKFNETSSDKVDVLFFGKRADLRKFAEML